MPFLTKRNRKTSASVAQPRTRKTGRIHQLWKKATSSTKNKALLGALIAIVGSLAALFVTSRGSIAPSFTIFRKTMDKIPGGLGKKIVYGVQRLVDLFLNAIGRGVKKGTVVTLKPDFVLIEKNQYDLDGGDGKNPEITVVSSNDSYHKDSKFVIGDTPGKDTVVLRWIEEESYLKGDMKTFFRDNEDNITYGNLYSFKDKDLCKKTFHFSRDALIKSDVQFTKRK